MARQKHLKGRFERPRRWRRRAALGAFVLVVLLVGAYLFLTSSTRLSRLAGDLLEDMTGAQVQIGQAEFGLDGIIRLHEVNLISPQMPGEEKRIFHAEQVLIRHDLMSLLRGQFAARSLILSHPTLYITEQASTGTFNYEFLRKDESDDPRTLPGVLPEVFIRRGQIVRGEVEGGVYRPIFRFNVDGKLTEHDDARDEYFFALRQYELDSDRGAQLTGQLNLRTMNVQVELDRFAVETRQGDVLPSRLRKWWQMYQPEGEFAAVRMSYDPEARAFRAELEVRNSALTLPYLSKEIAASAEALRNRAADPNVTTTQHQFRLTDVSGRFEIVNDRITVTNLQGTVEGVHYTIDGVIDGLDRDAPFQLSLRTRKFEVSQDPQFLSALPEAVRNGFNAFKPSGQFQLALHLNRPRGGELSYRGVVELTDARFTYAKFAYPLQQVNGRVIFNADTITIDNIQARGLTGAMVRLDGQIHPPDENAAVHLTITARQAPFDEHVLAALDEKFHPIIHMFGDEQALARLKARNLDLPGEPISEFTVGGTTDYDIVVSKPYGKGKPVSTTVTMQMAGMRVLFTHWPYPIRVTGGTLVIAPDHVEIHDITGEGLHGGGGVARGAIAMPYDQASGRRRFIPDIHIETQGLPLDELMLAAIPQPQDKWLRELKVHGSIDAHAHVFGEDIDRIDYRIGIDLRDGAAQPFEGAYAIDDLTGKLTVDRESVTIETLHGRHNESDLTFAGEVRSTKEAWRFNLDFVGRALRFEDPLLDLIPREHGASDTLAMLFETYKPQGAFDLQLSYGMDSVEGERYALAIEPGDWSFDFQDRRIALSDVRGKVTVEPGTITLDRFGANVGESAFDISGAVRMGEEIFADVVIDASGERLDDTVRLTLPAQVRAALDALKLEGGFKLTGGQLKYREPAAGAGTPSFSFNGDLAIHRGQAEVGVPIRDLRGSLGIFAARRSGDRWPYLELDLHADEMHAADRKVTDFDLRLASTDRRNVIALNELTGSVYGGLLRGSGQIDLSDQRQYLFQLVLLDAPLDPILHPANYADFGSARATAGVAPAVDADGSLVIPVAPPPQLRDLLETGRLSVSLDIEASMDRPLVRRGRGDLEIRGARMYELPLAMALLQMLNLSTPSSGAFDEANARFIIDGDQVLFDLVSITAPTVELTGEGTMRYSDRSLDLVMFSKNPQGPDLGALSDILNVVKDELVSVRVRGTLDDPDPQVTNFRGIRETWRALFGSDRDTAPPVTPNR